MANQLHSLHYLWQNCPVFCKQSKFAAIRASTGEPSGRRTVSRNASLAMPPCVGSSMDAHTSHTAPPSRPCILIHFLGPRSVRRWEIALGKGVRIEAKFIVGPDGKVYAIGTTSCLVLKMEQ
jgi:hypothetical protein